MIGGASVVVVALALYVLVSVGFAIYQFSSTKAELVSRGVSTSTAGLLAWMVLLAACALPVFAMARIVLAKATRWDYGAAMVCPLIS